MVIVRTFGDAIVSQELNNRLLFCVYSQNKFHTDEFWHFFWRCSFADEKA